MAPNRPAHGVSVLMTQADDRFQFNVCVCVCAGKPALLPVFLRAKPL